MNKLKNLYVLIGMSTSVAFAQINQDNLTKSVRLSATIEATPIVFNVSSTALDFNIDVRGREVTLAATNSTEALYRTETLTLSYENAFVPAFNIDIFVKDEDYVNRNSEFEIDGGALGLLSEDNLIIRNEVVERDANGNVIEERNWPVRIPLKAQVYGYERTFDDIGDVDINSSPLIAYNEEVFDQDEAPWSWVFEETMTTTDAQGETISMVGAARAKSPESGSGTMSVQFATNIGGAAPGTYSRDVHIRLVVE